MNETRQHEENNNQADIREPFNQSVEGLVGKYLEYENRISREGKQDDPEKERAIAFCREKLAEARTAIFPGQRGRRKVFLAWRLLHRVGEEMILLMDRPELIAYGARLAQEVKMAPIPEAAAGEWTSKLGALAQTLSQATCTADDEKMATRHYRHILKAVNESVDDSFWNLWAQKFIALLYALLLIVAGTAFFGTGICDEKLCTSGILLTGAIGGLLSGILTGERESIPKSHFLVPIVYYLLARPLIGAAAALVVFWAVESEFLVRVETYPPNQPTTVEKPLTPPTGASGGEKTAQPEPKAAIVPPGHPETPSQPPPAARPTPDNATAAATPAPAESRTAKIKDGGNPENAISVSMVTLRTAADKKHYLYMLILLFAGFSGDKLLKSIADRVTMKLIAQAEKTKESK